ncbi:MAG: DUF1844 domain-containing protein [Thermoanaerobaculia bacterium]
MSETEKTIKVVDRRLFTADGEVRQEALAEMEAPDPEPAKAEGADEATAEPKIASDPAFLRLIDMLAQTAAMYLEGFPDPANGRRQVDLAGARQIVESLMALREKTRGKLSFEETDSLDGLVSDLQMAFARLAPPPGAGKGPVPPPPSRRG